MRKTLTILAALAAFSALPGSAFADNPNAEFSGDHDAASDLGQTCTTPMATGVLGGPGAYYVDGCTARVDCPPEAKSCSVHTSSTFSILDSAGADASESIGVSQNARLRAINLDGSVDKWWDVSCVKAWSCTTPEMSTRIAPGTSTTIQCNGVIWSSGAAKGNNRCHIDLFENFA